MKITFTLITCLLLCSCAEVRRDGAQVKKVHRQLGKNKKTEYIVTCYIMPPRENVINVINNFDPLKANEVYDFYLNEELEVVTDNKYFNLEVLPKQNGQYINLKYKQLLAEWENNNFLQQEIDQVITLQLGVPQFICSVEGRYVYLRVLKSHKLAMNF